MHAPDRHDIPAHAQVVVVGSGPAGMTVAAQLSTVGIPVLVIESGPEADRLSVIDNVGHPRVEPQRLVRRRELGGSSVAWSGRCAPLDAIDYERREWVPGSGWPVTAEELEPYVIRAAELLGLEGTEYGDGVWPLLGLAAPDQLDDESIIERFWQFSRGRREPSGPTRFATDLPSEAVILTGATVTRLEHAGGRVSGVEVVRKDGFRATVTAGTVIVAGGAIENARLLLVSGLGNDNTGRYLMDHPGSVIGTIDPRSATALRDRFGTYWRPSTPFRLSYLNGMALSADAQRRERLLNAACWLDEYPAPYDPWQAGIRIAARLRGRTTAAVDADSMEFWRDADSAATQRPSLLHDALDVMRQPRLLARGAMRLLRHRPPLYRVDRIDLYALVEQLPDPLSRVTLSDRVDDLGVPIPRVDWRVHPEEYRAAVRLSELVREALQRGGLPAPQPVPWLSDFEQWSARVHDRAHQIGTTRMSAREDDGVVDRDCRVFGVDNLYLAGSSVFPTSGHVNPTLTLVALAIRLAETVATATISSRRA